MRIIVRSENQNIDLPQYLQKKLKIHSPATKSEEAFIEWKTSPEASSAEKGWSSFHGLLHPGQ
jgi:hypothetical protein